MNIYSINPSSEPGEARMRGTQGRNAHGRHGGCREQAARAGSLPCWRVKKKPPDGAGGFGVSVATEDVLGDRQGFSFGGFLCEADKVPTVRPFKKVEQ